MIYVIMGPTACGKSAAAHELSDYFSCPIINADAFQIYKDMNIGTNKVTKDDSHYSSYYLLDITTPDKIYSVKEYQDVFRKTIYELMKNNQNIIVCGGTGLYIRAALYDYQFPIQEEEDNQYLSLSNDELYEKLKQLDYLASTKIHPNNRKRVVRAINLIEHSCKSKTDIINEQNHCPIFDENQIRFLFINPDRNELYNRINNRVDEMIQLGLVNEVKSLYEKYKLSDTSKQGIGYKEMIAYLEGEITLENAIELIKKRTRNYAKRQVTFFKNQFKTQEFLSYLDLINEVKHNG